MTLVNAPAERHRSWRQEAIPMQALKLRRVALDTQTENVAFLAHGCRLYRPEDFRAMKRIEIRHAGGTVLATLMVASSGHIVGPDELGLSATTFDRLGLPKGTPVTIEPVHPPPSLDAVRQKIAGHILSSSQIESIIEDIIGRRYSEMEIAAFLVSCANFLTTDELLSLTRAMASAGNTLTWPDAIVADKHCIGGIPGNRTSMIVVPIVAAHGLMIPKTSSRAITSPAGTADTMEVLANVDLDMEEMQRVVHEHKGCLIWGGHVNLSPADDLLISVERPLRIDTREQMIASIMSKKAAAGSTHLVIDMPVGPSAKVTTMTEAMRVRKLFEFIADRMGLSVRIVTTDGSQPVGRGVGPVLEARDVVAVLQNDANAPPDLRERALSLAGRIIDYDPAVRGGAGYEVSRTILESGSAYRQFQRICEAQGRPPADAILGQRVRDILAPSDGLVETVDCLRLGRIARLAGAPVDKGAGLEIFKRIGDRVDEGEPLYRIYAAAESNFEFACDLAEAETGVSLNGMTVGA